MELPVGTMLIATLSVISIGGIFLAAAGKRYLQEEQAKNKVSNVSSSNIDLAPGTD